MTDDQRLEMALRQGSLDGPRPALVLLPAVDDPGDSMHESYTLRYGRAFAVGIVAPPHRWGLLGHMHAVGLLPSYFDREGMMRPAAGDTCAADGVCDGSCGVPA